MMNHRLYLKKDALDIYRNHYKKINGGIDGYYEKTILNADIYEVYMEKTIAYFSVHEDRGLTSLVVLSDSENVYESVFNYVIALPLFTNILFTENDFHFLKQIKKHHIPYEVQAYNFEVKSKIKSLIEMKRATLEDFELIMNTFGDFINYNHIGLSCIKSFVYVEKNQLISFGALEPLQLNPNRYCLSMVVNEKYRNKGYGTKTVQFLISYLQRNQLEINARCYVLNEPSKKTLLKSGLQISNKLFKATIRMINQDT